MDFNFTACSEESGSEIWDRFQIEFLTYLLDRNNCNKTYTAKELNISIKTLRAKIEQYPELHRYKNVRPGWENKEKLEVDFDPKIWR